MLELIRGLTKNPLFREEKIAFGSNLHQFSLFHPSLILSFCVVALLYLIPLREGNVEILEIRALKEDGRGKVRVIGAHQNIRLPKDKLEKLKNYDLLFLERGKWTGEGEESFFISPLTRYKWKENIRSSLKKRFKGGDMSDLFSSLVMGTSLPSGLQELFRKTGLLHLVAISGFHFSLLKDVVFFILGFFTRGKSRLGFLLLFLGGYALVLGGIPSVLRAFFGSLIALLGQLFHRNSKPLNTFGLTLILTLMMDRTLLYELSFQMSFGITFAILTLFPVLLRCLKEPTLEEVRSKKLSHQCFFVLRTLFERSILFSLAVAVMALPLSLYAFGSFPCFSIFINLLFVPLFSLLGCGIVLSTLLPFLDPLVAYFGELILEGLYFFDRPLPIIEGEIPFFIIFLIILSLTLIYSLSPLFPVDSKVCSIEAPRM